MSDEQSEMEEGAQSEEPCGGTSAFGESCSDPSCGWCHDNGWAAQ